jgi:hypothetical protein
MRLSYPLLLSVLGLALVLPGAAATEAPSAPEALTRLQSSALELELAPKLGGRATRLSAPGRNNVLRVGDLQVVPKVSATGENIPYMGHEVWAGPQSDWWRFQTLNPGRRKAAAQWPPDPWLVYAGNRLLSHDDQHAVLEGQPSPVSGIQLTQSYRILSQRPDTVEVDVQMRNIRKEPVARDIWFNTRVDPRTRVYVPVEADGSGVRVRSDTGDGYDGLVSNSADGLFSLELLPPGEGLHGRRGKVFIQPRAGWMAGFTQGQVLLIHFEHQPAERIHPEQGQVELYLEWQAGREDEAGLMELEVHAPYQTLAPGQTVSAREWWVVRPYDGPDRRDAQVAFLRRLLEEVGVE